MGRRTRRAHTLHAWMLAAETVLQRLANRTTNGADRAELLEKIDAMQPIRHEWRWLAGIGENPRLEALRTELEALTALAAKNGPGTGQGAYCISIMLLEQRIREVEAEGREGC